jgi:hypothetical protein
MIKLYHISELTYIAVMKGLTFITAIYVSLDEQALHDDLHLRVALSKLSALL